MAKCVIVTILLLSVFSGGLGQWPLGEGFYAGMNQLQLNMNKMTANLEANMQAMQYNMAANMQAMQNNMATNMQAMRERMARQRQYIRNVYVSGGYRPGFNRFSTANGGTGYVYNSPDGSVNMFSYSSGPQYSGYEYRSGPEGSYYRRW